MEPRVDFSRFSKVKDSLKEELMGRYENGKKTMLMDDELDSVAAAQLGWRPQPVRKKNHKKTYWKLPF